MLRFTLTLCVSLATSALFAAESPQPLAVGTTQAPPLERIKPGQEVAIGLWDDVFPFPHADVLVLRRGPEIHVSTLDLSTPTKHLKRNPALERTRFVGAIAAKGHRWVFLQRQVSGRAPVYSADGGGKRVRMVDWAEVGTPLAVDLDTGKLAEFIPAGVRMKDVQQLGIHASPDHGGAIVVVSGVDPASSPTKTPVYVVRFWLDLSTGKTVQLPLDWSWDYFSTDLRWAVREGWEEVPGPKAAAGKPRPPLAPPAPPAPGAAPRPTTAPLPAPPSPPRPPRSAPPPPPPPLGPLERVLRGLDLQTGQLVETGVPDFQKETWVLGERYNRPAPLSEAEPLYRPKPRNTMPILVGVASGGKAFPWKLALEQQGGSTAKAVAGWAALQYGRYGLSRADAESLWFGPLQAGAEPRRLASHVREYEVLGAGRCLLVASHIDARHDPFHAPASAYFYEDQKQGAWNVLEGVAGLPPLDPEVAAKPYIDERRTVRLLASFGSRSAGRMVLASFEHCRADLRASLPSPREPRVPTGRWHQKILLTSDGRRLAIDLADQESQQLWLHDSGVLVRATAKAPDDESGLAPRLSVWLVPLELRPSKSPPKGDGSRFH